MTPARTKGLKYMAAAVVLAFIAWFAFFKGGLDLRVALVLIVACFAGFAVCYHRGFNLLVRGEQAAEKGSESN